MSDKHPTRFTASWLTGLFLLSTFTGAAQYPEQHVINHSDTIVLQQQIDEARNLMQSWPDSAAFLLQQAYTRSASQGYTAGIHNALYHLAELAFRSNRWDQGKAYLQQLIKICNPENAPLMVKAYALMGLAFAQKGKFKEAFGQYTQALPFVRDSLRDLPILYNNMADVLQQLNEYDKALSLTNKAIDLARRDPQRSRISAWYIARGKQQIPLTRYPEAIASFDSALYYARQYRQYTDWIGALCFKANALTYAGNMETALQTIRQAEALLQQQGPTLEPRAITVFHGCAGYTYFKAQQYTHAESHYMQLKTLSVREPYTYAIATAHLSDLYATTGDYTRAYRYKVEAQDILDSLRTQEIQANVHEMETRYRTVEKDKEIALKTLRLAESEKRNAQKSSLILAIASGAALLLLSGTWRYAYLRRKEKHTQEIEHLKGIIEGEEKERARLAHDLHDGINSQLTAIQSYLLAQANLLPVLEQAPHYTAAQNLLSATTHGVRTIAHNLAPEDLARKGLKESIQGFCREIFAAAGIEADIVLYGAFENVDPALGLNLYRMVQELAQNIVKHAEATTVTLLVTEEVDKITLVMEDNGKGIPEALLNQKEYAGIGLSGLHNRVKMHEGSLSITSAPDQGTTVHISLPLGGGKG